MVRLSSKDASLLIDVLEHDDLPQTERLKLLDGADHDVLEIGKALIDPTLDIQDDAIREAVTQIQNWFNSDESK